MDGIGPGKETAADTFGLVKSGGKRRLQLRKSAPNAFSAAKKTVFLDVLGQTVNVTRSARAASVALTTVYRHKRRDPMFAEAWHDALCEGYDMLEMMMLRQALRQQRAQLGECDAEDEADLGVDAIETEGSDADKDADKDADTGQARRGAAPKLVPFSNADAMRLLKMHRDTVMARRAQLAARAAIRPGDRRKAMRARLRALHARMLAEDRDERADAAPD